jgi:CxxC motif-containing protein
MRNLTCIVCPIGCSLTVEESAGGGDAELNVTGNRCQRGLVYAREEVRAPKRTVTATCRVTGDSHVTRRIPVKTATPCPREKIPALLRDIYRTKIDLPVSRGDTVISDWMSLGIDIVATRSVPSGNL